MQAPTGRPEKTDLDAEGWRADAVRLLRRRWAGPGTLAVVDTVTPTGDYTADAVLFWVPSGTRTSTLTDDASWCGWRDTGRTVLGIATDAVDDADLTADATARGVRVTATLADAVTAALALAGPGVERADAERGVPLRVWHTSSFQSWYAALRGAGHSLTAASLVWTFPAGWEDPHYWALHAGVRVAVEDRIKTNEVVLSRPDLAVAVLYRRGSDRDATRIVLVREFRTPVRSADGFVHELPGGSGPDTDLRRQATQEVLEETGLRLAPERLRPHVGRQVAATLSAHHAHVFSAELDEQELVGLRDAQRVPHGEAGSSERTWIELTTYREIRRGRLVDWSTMGMISQVLDDLSL